MKCPKCGLQEMVVDSTSRAIDKDGNIYVNHLIGCKNEKCLMYVGDNNENARVTKVVIN